MSWKIKGQSELEGIIKVGGAKNAVLPILCASIIPNEPVTLTNVPHLTDVENIEKILNSINITTQFENNTLIVQNQSEYNHKEVDPYLAGKLRASFLIAGALLGKYGSVKFPLPGGCSIGQRPIDLHLKAFTSLGATWEIEHGEVIIKGPLKSGTIFFDFPSVGATENAILAAVSIEGTTTILNGAEEPEIMDLVQFLNSLGAKIEKVEGKTFVVHGGRPLKGGEYQIMTDRIEAGTWLTLSALTDGKVKVQGVDRLVLDNFMTKLTEIGVQYIEDESGISVSYPKHTDMSFQTGPHPSFPTDLQPQTLVLSCFIKGMHIAVETVFENRFQHVPELIKMGANIKVLENKIAVIYGGEKLTGARVKATDLRAGAALLLAGLFAEGDTILEDVYHIERGYEDILNKLKQINAVIKAI